MATIEDASDVFALLLEGDHSTIAGRLAGAFRNTGHARIADEIKKTMEAAGYTVREPDSFKNEPGTLLATREASPYVDPPPVLGPGSSTGPSRQDIPRRRPRADLRVKLADLTLMVSPPAFTTVREHLAKTINRLTLLRAHLMRMNLEFRGDLLHRPVSPKRLQRNLRLQLP